MLKENKIVNSLIWKFLERFGTVGIQFVIQIFLARLLAPNDYGSIALITVFITVSNVFVQNGFNTALIQSKDIKEEDYSSVFWISLAIAGVCYLSLFILAPLIASFYEIYELKNILRVLGVTLFFGSYNSIQVAKISREFKFKNLFYSSLLGIITSGIVGIYLAFKGFGIWTLVVQQLLNQMIVSAVLYFEVKWKLQFTVNFKRVKALFSFGSKLLISSLIDVLYNNLYNLVIGKLFNSTMLGYYNRADQFPNLIVSNVNGSIQSVILPALSEHQDDPKRVKELVRKAMSLSSFTVFPAMFGMAACAEPIVKLLLTDKWLPIVPMLQLLCFSYALWPIHTANLQAINAMGRSDIFLKLEVIKKIIGIIALIISFPFGIMAMVAMKMITGIVSTFINSFPNRKLLLYGYFEQIKDILPSLICSFVMFISILVFNYYMTAIISSTFLLLVLDILLGIFSYLFLAILTKNKNLKFILRQFKKGDSI